MGAAPGAKDRLKDCGNEPTNFYKCSADGRDNAGLRRSDTAEKAHPSQVYPGREGNKIPRPNQTAQRKGNSKNCTMEWIT